MSANKILKGSAIVTARVLAGRAFLIKTPACEVLFAKLLEWITSGQLGGMVYGRPRLGKTSAVRYVLKMLQLFLKEPLPWFEVPARQEAVKTDGAFFEYLLKCVGHQHCTGTAGQKRTRLKEFLFERAKSSSWDAVILFFDEAQYIAETRYMWLQNLSNELEKEGVRLFVLLVGQHQLLHRRTVILEQGLEEIVGRFMAQDMPFPALTSVDSVRSCLTGYDNAKFPDEDGQPFGAYYVPQAYANGWRLSSLSEDMWDAFAKVWRNSNRVAGPEVGMFYLNSAICALLNRLVNSDGSAMNLPSDAVQLAVHQSGYAGALRALAPTPPSKPAA